VAEVDALAARLKPRTCLKTQLNWEFLDKLHNYGSVSSSMDHRHARSDDMRAYDVVISVPKRGEVT
jgi:hypothetical protein